MDTNTCKHENIRWFSGEVGVHITLNPYAAECLDCGSVATMNEEM